MMQVTGMNHHLRLCSIPIPSFQLPQAKPSLWYVSGVSHILLRRFKITYINWNSARCQQYQTFIKWLVPKVILKCVGFTIFDRLTCSAVHKLIFLHSYNLFKLGKILQFMHLACDILFLSFKSFPCCIRKYYGRIFLQTLWLRCSRVMSFLTIGLAWLRVTKGTDAFKHSQIMPTWWITPSSQLCLLLSSSSCNFKSNRCNWWNLIMNLWDIFIIGFFYIFFF